MKKIFPDFFQKLVKENQLFFILFIVFIVVGGVFLSLINQGDVILFFSENRSALGNLFFKYFTKMGEEVIYVAVLLLFLLTRYRYAIILPFLGFSVSVISYLSKTYFGHYRPSLYYRQLGTFDEINLVEGVILNGGANSFPSGHTMSAFALYAFLAFCFPQKKSLGALFFIIAFLVGISRIYLVQHFFEDVYLGAIIGVFIGMGWYFVQSKFPDQPEHWTNKSLLKNKIFGKEVKTA